MARNSRKLKFQNRFPGKFGPKCVLENFELFFKSALEAVSALLKDISWKFGLKLPGFLEAVGLKLHGIMNQFLFKSALKILSAL